MVSQGRLRHLCYYLHDIPTFTSKIALKTMKNYADLPLKLEYIRI